MLWRFGLKKSDASSTDRLPPGQRWVKGWPVLHEGAVPAFDPATWTLSITGAVETPVSVSWADFTSLPATEVTRDWHCVTTWSKKDNRWGGVSVMTLLEQAKPLPGASHVLVRSFDPVGYTTNLTLDDFARPENLFATHHSGEPLAPRHGGPMRLVVHHLYAWKSAKWVSEIELLTEDEKGFWEVRGYHNRADPWREERYAYQDE
ncbi:MAG: sulfite oxidase-like oxidoreductase [Myxococcota bacterium]